MQRMSEVFRSVSASIPSKKLFRFCGFAIFAVFLRALLTLHNLLNFFFFYTFNKTDSLVATLLSTVVAFLCWLNRRCRNKSEVVSEVDGEIFFFGWTGCKKISKNHFEEFFSNENLKLKQHLNLKNFNQKTKSVPLRSFSSIHTFIHKKLLSVASADLFSLLLCFLRPNHV